MLKSELRPGDSVVMDNLPSHKRVTVREQVKMAGATLRLIPLFSADINPIEQAFSQFKAILCNGGKRTISDLWNRIEDFVDKFQPDDCAKHFRSGDYQPI